MAALIRTLLFFLASPAVWAAPAAWDASNFASGTGTSAVVSVTASADVSAVYVVLFGDGGAPALPSSISWGSDSVSTTAISSDGTAQQPAYVYRLLSPTQTGTQNVTVSYGASQTYSVGAFTLTGDIDSGTPESSFQVDSVSGLNALTGTAVTSETDDLVISILNLNVNSSDSPTSSQTDRDVDNQLSSTNGSFATAAGAASVGTNWSWTSFTRATSVSFNVNTGAASGPVIPVLHHQLRNQ